MNASFDRLYKLQNLRSAKESLNEWRKSRALENLTSEEIEFLDRAIISSEKHVAVCERHLKAWWE